MKQKRDMIDITRYPQTRVAINLASENLPAKPKSPAVVVVAMEALLEKMGLHIENKKAPRNERRPSRPDRSEEA